MSTPSPGPHLKRELGLVPLIAVIFFSVSGGRYGIEDAVPSFGPGLTLLLLLLTPIVWSLPVAAVASFLAVLAMLTSGLVNIIVGLIAALTGPAAYITFARSERGDTLST